LECNDFSKTAASPMRLVLLAGLCGQKERPAVKLAFGERWIVLQ
jgi:hypothetical protein